MRTKFLAPIVIGALSLALAIPAGASCKRPPSSSTARHSLPASLVGPPGSDSYSSASAPASVPQ